MYCDGGWFATVARLNPAIGLGLLKEMRNDKVDIEQAKGRFPELVELAAGGEDAVISKDMRPIVRLTHATGKKEKPQLGSARGLITPAKDFDEPLEDLDTGYETRS